MKVLLVTNMYPSERKPYYGIFVKEQMDTMTRFFPDIEYDIYCIEGSGGASAGKWKSITNYLRSIWEVDNKLRSGQYDFVHVHYGFSGLYLLNPFHKKTPVLITLHGGDIQLEQKKQFQVFATRRILKHASFAITLNERMNDIVQCYIDTTKIIPCSIDTSLFKPLPFKKNQSNKPLIVFPSNKDRFEKNYPLFKETIVSLKSLYGIDCETCELKNMSRNEVKEIYQKADLLLMTSISEGSPQVVKEAMACDLPVVSTPVGDVSVLLKNVKNSAVAKSFNPDELASLCLHSLNGQIEGTSGRDKIFQLGLDDASTSHKIYEIYQYLKTRSFQ